MFAIVRKFSLMLFESLGEELILKAVDCPPGGLPVPIALKAASATGTTLSTDGILVKNISTSTTLALTAKVYGSSPDTVQVALDPIPSNGDTLQVIINNDIDGWIAVNGSGNNKGSGYVNHIS